MRKIALYARVSTDEQARVEEGSIKNQLQSLRNYVDAENLKWEGNWGVVIDQYVDDGWSAKNLNRPAMKRMLADVKQGRVDTIIFTDLTRLTRSGKDYHYLFDLVLSHDANMLATKMDFDTSTPQGRMFVSLMVSMAQFEREQTGERVRTSIVARSERGLWTGGMVPFGLRLTNKKGLLEPDPGSAEHVDKLL